MRIFAGFLLAGFCAAACGQVLQSKTYATTGHAASVVETADGQYVLVTVDRGKDGSGIDVFHIADGALNRVAFQPLGKANAQGIVLIPHTQMLAVGMSNAGVAFLPLKDVLEGKAKPRYLAQGEQAGSGYLAVTPDGQTLFVANEYGDHGNVGVIALHRDDDGQIHPEAKAHLPTPRATPGITLSPDGRTLYAVSEVVPEEFAMRLPGHEMYELQHRGCTQGGPRSMPNGLLYAFDVAKAAALGAQPTPAEMNAAQSGWSNAGCSPVRETLNDDGTLLYVTARGDNRILVFDPRKLVLAGPPALVSKFSSGGGAPIGLKLFDGGKMLLVANSDRFGGGKGSADVIDVSDLKKAKVVQKIKTGEFPRNIAASADGKTLYLTIFLGDQLMVLREK